MQQRKTHPKMQQCIDRCLDCYQICFSTAMSHCLPTGGRHIEAQHLGLMLNCAELCRTAAEFMMSSSPLHARVCAACAEVCDACAESCQQLGGMDECIRACRVCAQNCRHMGGSTEAAPPAAAGLAGSERQEDDSPVKAPM
jgi:hypothetical protein